MKMLVAQLREPNFGDDLNRWLWPQIFPGLFDDDDRVLFIGIGSTVNARQDGPNRKIVFGGGFVPEYGGRPDVKHGDWRFYFVRGPRTAAALDLPASAGLGDGAILLRTVWRAAPSPGTGRVCFVPHWESMGWGFWPEVCARAGVELIDPRAPAPQVLDRIAGARLVIAEAMHGAIVADALRVPWVAMRPICARHRTKWLDWAEALDIDLRPLRLAPSSVTEIATLRIRRLAWLESVRRSSVTPVLAPLRTATVAMATASLEAAARAPAQLSDDRAITRATERMAEQADRLARHCRAGAHAPPPASSLACRAPKVRLAVVSIGSPSRRSAWSGTPYHLVAELRRRYGEVRVIETPWTDAVLARLSPLRRLGIVPRREPLPAGWLGRAVQRRLAGQPVDAVVAINAEQKICRLPAGPPMILVSDALFGAIVDYYPTYARVGARGLRNGETIQREALARVQSVLLSSQWAARDAVGRYGGDPARFRVAPFGANLDAAPASAPRDSEAGPLRLLFVGRDWRRKGGELALAAFEHVRRAEPDAELHIVGCRPPGAAGRAGVTVHGLLDKDEPPAALRLDRLWREASMLFVPSRQEAFGIVFCEAFAYGLPAVALETGGVPDLVRDGVNGLLLAPDVGADACASAILALWRDPARYRRLCSQAREDYEQRLNWRAWGEIFDQEMRRILPRATPAPVAARAPEPAVSPS